MIEEVVKKFWPADGNLARWVVSIRVDGKLEWVASFASELDAEHYMEQMDVESE